MKFSTIVFTTVLLALPVAAQEKSPAPSSSPPFKDLKDRVSYAIGLNVGLNFKKQNVDLNPELFAQALKDAQAGKPQMTVEQVKETMGAFEKDMVEKQKQAGEKNKVEGEKFLSENKSKAGVKTTASGLQYKVLKEGSGASPTDTDTVTVNYRGTLINGTEFDSSYKRGEPATFPVQGVIKGWTEALKMMKKGAKYQLFVPSGLAYADRAAGADISPNSTLIFEVELLDIKPAAAGGSPGPEEKEKEKAKP